MYFFFTCDLFCRRIASNASVFRGACILSLPTNACSTESNIPFPSLANHTVLSKFWKVDLELLAKSSCSHRLIFFFWKHKGYGIQWRSPIVVIHQDVQAVIGQLTYIFMLNSFDSKFWNKRLESEVLQRTLREVFFLRKQIGMVACLSLTMRKSRNWGAS